MTFIQWTSEYLTGLSEVDAQHQKLVWIINSLHDGIKRGETDSAISKIINELEAYTHFHFSLEESLMLLHNSEFYDAHKKEHDYFRDKVKEYQKKSQFGHTALSIEIINFLMDWLLHHILEADKLFAPFILGKGEK